MTTLPFFYSILKPAPEFNIDEEEEDAQPEGLGPELYPFQRRSVRWMLEREGKKLNHHGKVENIKRSGGGMICWEKLELPLRNAPRFGELVERVDAKEKKRTIWFDRLSGALARTEKDVRASSGFLDLGKVKGGMLCEEMGE